MCGDLLGARDKAMLGVYYGCGLRRSEEVSLDQEDINFEKGLLYVRKGKNYKQRFVPFTERVKEGLYNYLHYARPMLAKGNEQALF